MKYVSKYIIRKFKMNYLLFNVSSCLCWVQWDVVGMVESEIN